MRYIVIATMNRCTGYWEGKGAASYHTADLAGLRMERRYWRDMYTDAHGWHAIARRRHFKKLPRKVRRAILAGVAPGWC